MAIEIPPATLARFDARQRAIIDVVNEWGYFEIGLAREHALYRGRNILDIGMGGGPHSIPFIVGGAASYTGVDPMVGTEQVSDFRALRDLSRPSYAPFPYTPDEIMAAFPNIRLHSGYMEDVAPRLQASGIDFIALSAVTEHLERPDQVIKAAWEAGADDAVIWISHANYYSWSGHHLNPRTLETWNPDDPAHNSNIDWAHLAPEHPTYAMPHLNRMRLDDFRALVEAYFEIIQWREYLEYPERLTPEIRHRWKKYTTSELLARMAYV
ncbi:MAG: class I SAM-dependent methyltransferase, partial [Thiohalocapsa sp.]